ncbi:Penicillin acylase (Penicillin amidase), partial [hydrothermal vent metagenome]
VNPDERFGSNPILGRDQLMSEAFNNAVNNLTDLLRDNLGNWQYGQKKFKHTYFEHALSSSVNKKTREKLDLGPLPRGGNSFTVGSTGGNLRQSSGASFRMIVNTGNWDSAIATNGPGQSGNPDSPFYSNLFEPWAKDMYFPVYYSREKVDSVSVNKILLTPKN